MTNGYQKLENRIMNKVELFNDHFQNFKVYGIPKAQLIIADPPYNLGKNAYASNPSWYVDGDNKNGESDKAGKEIFDTDKDFRPAEFMHFVRECRERPGTGKACMIVFCEFEHNSSTSNLASNTDSTITSTLCSARTFPQRY